jgi:hypothetical protein
MEVELRQLEEAVGSIHKEMLYLRDRYDSTRSPSIDIFSCLISFEFPVSCYHMLVELRELCIVSRLYVSSASHLLLHWRNGFVCYLDLQNISCSSSNLAVKESRCTGFISSMWGC